MISLFMDLHEKEGGGVNGVLYVRSKGRVTTKEKLYIGFLLEAIRESTCILVNTQTGEDPAEESFVLTP